MNSMETALVLAWVAILLLAFGFSGVLRQVRELQGGASHNPETVGPPPGLDISRLDRPIHIRGKESILLFAEASCDSCRKVMPALKELASQTEIPFVIVLAGKREFDPPSNVQILENRMDAFESLHIPATPFAMHVNADGKIRSGSLIGSPEGLNNFVASRA